MSKNQFTQSQTVMGRFINITISISTPFSQAREEIKTLKQTKTTEEELIIVAPIEEVRTFYPLIFPNCPEILALIVFISNLNKYTSINHGTF